VTSKLAKEDRETFKDLSVQQKIDFIPTGSWVIDKLIGNGDGNSMNGGLPRGHVVEVYGNESCGKTTLAISASAKAQQMGLSVLWLDYERTFQRDYAAKLGLSFDPNKWSFHEPYTFEQGARLIEEYLNSYPGLIVIDSVPAMTPEKSFDAEADEILQIGLKARKLSELLGGKLLKFIPHTNTCVFLINQMRSIIRTGGFVPPGAPTETSTGGQALKYYTSVRIKMQTGAKGKVERFNKITGKNEELPVDVKVKVSIEKNKIDRPFFSGPVYIRAGYGFDNFSSLVELAVNTNTIKKSGSFYSFENNGELVFKCQGEETVRIKLENDPSLMELLTSNIKIKIDEKVAQEAKEDEAVLKSEADTSASIQDALDDSIDDKPKYKKKKK
jgi:recombination protein RecA